MQPDQRQVNDSKPPQLEETDRWFCTGTCPPDPGLATSDYFIDFTQQSSLPANWTLANYETVTYGPNGATFTFNKRYDAPYIWTDFYFLFSTVEVVMQAAPGAGIISSSVLISDDLDEIDWEFSGNNFGSSSGKVQTNYFGKGITGNYDRGTQPSVDSPQTEFHTYTIDWTSTSLTWSVDGTALRTLFAADADTDSHQYPQTPMQLHLGLWDAGDADSSPATVEWGGGYTDLSQAPFTMYVKSVRIVNSNPCGNYQYTDTSGTWQSIQCLDPGSNGTSVVTSGNSSATSPVPTSLNTDPVGPTQPNSGSVSTPRSSSTNSPSVSPHT